MSEIKNRNELAPFFAGLGFNLGAEVGVAHGDFAKILCDANPNLVLHCIDIWGDYEGYSGNPTEEMYEMAVHQLAPYTCKIIKSMSMDAVKTYDDEYFDFVYIDCNHGYKYVKEDIEAWTPKVRKGGIVSGHDYQRAYTPISGTFGVIEAVDEYIKEKGYDLKTTGERKAKSWYFTK